MPNVQDTALARVVIANGGTVSTPFRMAGYRTLGIETATVTGATFTFTAARSEDGTYKAVVDQAGAAISVTATDDSMIGLDAAAAELAPWPWVRLVSASAEAAEREIWVHLKA